MLKAGIRLQMDRPPEPLAANTKPFFPLEVDFSPPFILIVNFKKRQNKVIKTHSNVKQKKDISCSVSHYTFTTLINVVFFFFCRLK